MPPSPDTLFQLANPLAMLGWIALLFAPMMPRWADRIAALAIPLLLSVAYTALILVHWAAAEGGYSSLQAVMQLFANPNIALAGWLHYLAFDLLIGAWISRTARAEAIPHAAVIPCLALTFLFGPIGYLAFLALQYLQSQRQKAATT